MTTYWHVAPPTYTPGDDLLCWDKLIDRGLVTDADWKWDEASVGTDGHLVCLFADDERGRQERDWMADEITGGYVLRVDIADDDDVELSRAEWEPYAAVVGSIPARCITVERRTS